jgi:uncharacterized RDD family membrane protein YckC
MSRSISTSNASAEEIGLDLKIETPENVKLTYQLAGPAIRLGAYMIDWGIRAFVLTIIFLFVGCAGIMLPGTAMGIATISMFVMEWCYFIIAEGFFRGKTIGKHALGLRVIHDQGHPLTFWGSMIRNLLRGIDCMPLYGPALISMVLTQRLQRLGDLVAGTVVISERRVKLPREPIILEKIEPLPRQELGSYVPERGTLSLIEDFLTRRHVLSHERGHAMVAPLARVLAKRLRFQGDPDLPLQFPMAFLARLYVTFLQRDDEEDEDQIDWKPKRKRQRKSRRPRQRQTASDW